MAKNSKTQLFAKNACFPYTTADYWKSQARKYCDFCKCWITDNKPSVDFHEKGRRHQDNVAKRLKFITKKSRKEEKETLKIDATLKQIEADALDAYRKDVENNADWTSVSINKKLQENNLILSGAKKVWKESKSDDGRTYYWNILTSESVSEPPKEGYLSLQEQQLLEDDALKTQIKDYQKHMMVNTRLRLQEEEKEEAERRAAAAREKLKARRVEDIVPVVAAPIIPAGKTEPYGQWQTVTIREPVDFQLPQSTQEYIKEEFDAEEVPEETEPVVKEFKEKVVESLAGGQTSFKKRKFGQCAKRNTRKRVDDD